MEMSHRSAAFEGIIQKAEADLRALLGLGADHAVLFLQGGASLQFAMVPANLRAAGASADYVLSGHWSKAALKEAQKAGRARAAGSTEASAFDRVPAQDELDLDPEAAYLHFTSNNTIYGTQWSIDPEPPAGVPLVCDASSDILSRPIDVAALRPSLRGGAEEPRARRGDRGRGAEGPARARAGRPSRDAGLPPDGREPLPLQHAAHLRDLRGGARPRVGQGERRPRRGREAERREGGAALRRDRRQRRVLPRPRPARQPLADERHVPPALGGAREGVPEGSPGGRHSTG